MYLTRKFHFFFPLQIIESVLNTRRISRFSPLDDEKFQKFLRPRETVKQLGWRFVNGIKYFIMHKLFLLNLGKYPLRIHKSSTQIGGISNIGKNSLSFFQQYRWKRVWHPEMDYWIWRLLCDYYPSLETKFHRT